MDCVYRNVIIIGYGQIVNNCILRLNELRAICNFNLTYVEYENTSLSTSIELCKKEEINYLCISDKSDLKDYFLDQAEKTLIISAGNFYIFPKEVVKKENLTIINFHSALLPKYPGRNAQSWAMFLGEKEAGATWHFVNEEIDAGKYIMQKSCAILEDTKAYELTGAIMDVAYEGFCEIIEGVLADKYNKVQDIPTDKNRRVYKGKDIPGNGRFSLSDSVDYIYLLLRSVDYGKSDIFPPVETEIDEKNVTIKSYKKIKNEGITNTIIEEGKIFIPFDDEYVLRIKYRQ